MLLYCTPNSHSGLWRFTRNQRNKNALFRARSVLVIGLRLLNRRALGRPNLPATIALDEDVREADSTIRRLALRIAAYHTVDTGDDGSVALRPDVQIGEVERL